MAQRRDLAVDRYWTRIVESADRGFVLEPEQFYIFATRERLRIPPDLCAELVPFDATKGELEGFLERLVVELDATGFLDNIEKRPGMVRNLRHWFQRGEVTEQELRTLHGVVTELSRGRMRRGRPEKDATPPWRA
jgi:hypothetical protein